MKNSLYLAAFVLLLSVVSFGQGAGPGVMPVKPGAAKPEAFTREKFDPTRDPKIDLEKTVGIAAKSGKRIILDVGGEWCGWCVYMDRFFYQNPALAKLRNDNYVWVKVNFGPENENPIFLAAYPTATGYPHLYVLDETGKLLHSQDTSLLEEGKGYNLTKFTEFIKKWVPKKETPAAVN